MQFHPAVEAAQKHTRRDKQELRCGGNPGARKTLNAQVRQRTHMNIAVIRKEKTRVAEEYCRRSENWSGEPVPPGTEPRIVSRFVGVTYTAAIAVAILDGGVSAIIGAGTFNLALTAAVVAGALLALILTVIFEGVCGHLAARFQDRPRKAAAVLDRALPGVAIPWTICFFGALFVGRFASGGAYADTLFNALVTALAVLSPLLSALLLVCAGIRGWDRGPVRLYQRLEKIERDLAELQERCKEHADDDGSPPVARVEPSSPNMPPASGLAAVLLVALALAARAQPGGQLWVDGSRSPDAVNVARALDASLAIVPQVTEAMDVRTVELYKFAGDSFDAAPVGKPLQLPLFAPPDCETPRQSSERARIFKTPDKDRECTAKVKAASKQHEQAIADEMRRGRDELVRHVPSIPNRTCIIDLLARLGMPASHSVRFAIVVTDGVETCEPGTRQPLPAPADAIDVVLVLVPGRGQNSAPSARRRFQELKSLWEQRAPWLKAVIPRSGLSAELFGRGAPAVQK